MFALWYGSLFYREYRDIIRNKLSSKQQTTPAPKETAIVTPLPPKKIEPSRVPVIEPSRQIPSPASPKPIPSPTLPSPKPKMTSIVNPPVVPTTPISTIKREPIVPAEPLRSLEPPPKPPRSPSPHPIRAEAFEEVDIDDEEDEEEDEDGSEVEEDDENSVISASPRRGPMANSVNDFINKEISSQNQSR